MKAEKSEDAKLLLEFADLLYSVSVTPDHSLFVYRNSRVLNIPSDQVAVGDYIAVKNGTGRVGSCASG
ncbi:MAG: hypothetical protein ACP5LF_06715, partial [Nitrososphaeria archaeon]